MPLFYISQLATATKLICRLFDMRTEVAIYLPAGRIPESRRGFWWEQKQTCPTTPGWIRCRSTTLSEARTEAPVWLIHQAPQRAAPVLLPADLNFTSTPSPSQTPPPVCEMLPGFAALNIRSGKSKWRGKWTAVQAPAVLGFGVQNYGWVSWTLWTSSSILPNRADFHWPKVCE